MNKYFTSAVCPKCGGQLKTSDIKGYAFVCEECDENFYTMEVKKNSSDLYEVNIPMSTASFKQHENELLDLSDKYDCVFVGHDNFSNLTDIGWEDKFPDGKTLNQFVEDLDAILNPYIFDTYNVPIKEDDIVRFEDTGEYGYEIKEGFKFENFAVVFFDKEKNNYSLKDFAETDNSYYANDGFDEIDKDFFKACTVVGNIYDGSRLAIALCGKVCEKDDKCCRTCKWYSEEICCNGDSKFRAETRREYQTCEKWWKWIYE